jgi:transcriptional regulator with XRE-family HTH domain
MAKTDFSKRFRELVVGLTDTELGFVLGVTADAARKLRNGDIKSLKLHAALRLARELQISPWYLAGEPEPDGTAPRTAIHRDKKQAKRNQAEPSESRLREELGALRARIVRLESSTKNRPGW